MRNKISIWLVTIIVFSAAFFFIGNHVCTESNKEAANSEVYKYPSAAFGLSEIESINVITYITNGRKFSCLMIKYIRPLNINSEIVDRENMYKKIDAILGPGSSAINEIASSFSSGGSLVSSNKTMAVFLNKERNIIIIPSYTSK